MVLLLGGDACETGEGENEKKNLMPVADHTNVFANNTLIVSASSRREGRSKRSQNTPLCPLIYTLSHDGRRTSPQTAGPARDQDDGQRRGAAARATHRLQLTPYSGWLCARCGARRRRVRDAF